MFHNTLVVGSSIRKPGKSSKTAKRPAIWIGVRPGELVGHQPCSITLWWLVRVRPAPPPSRLQPENPDLLRTGLFASSHLDQQGLVGSGQGYRGRGRGR